MACVTNVCFSCDHHWAGLQKECPKCHSEDTIQEFDEEGMHDEIRRNNRFEYEKNPER